MSGTQYLNQSLIDGYRNQEKIEFWEAFDLPKTTRQSSLRIFKSKEGKSFIGKDKKANKLDNLLNIYCSKYKPQTPLKGALICSITFTYQYRKGEPLRNRICPIPMDKRPDVDNLAKATIDWLSKGFMMDDAQIVDLHLKKYWSTESSIYILLKPYEYPHQ
jgi:Holliday junction resolvase RusA-like endonuclease